jgi:hypothetical protein
VPVVSNRLDSLPEAPESIIVRSFFDAISVDSRLSMFNPWKLIELDDPSRTPQFNAYTAIVSPAAVRVEDWPSKRETIRPECVVGFAVPFEPTSLESKLYGLRLLNIVRIIANEICANTSGVVDTVVTPGRVLTDAFANVRPLPVMPSIDAFGKPISPWWIRSHVTWTTDINPVDGTFI